VLLYRVFPYLATARANKPGRPLYNHPVQGKGRWDNPSLYSVRYLATSPEAAIGESFGHLARWAPNMLAYPSLPGSERRLATYRFDETANPLLDLDDAEVLSRLHVRPSHVVIRNRPRTQQIAADIFNEQRWAGIQWWSYQRPQWTVVALWATGKLTVASVEELQGHPALDDAARVLAKSRRGL
jgi:uncharacterized protein YcaQ